MIAVSVDDGLGGVGSADVFVNVVDVNDEPTLFATGNNPTFTEGGPAADLFSAVTASTVETGQSFTSLTLTVDNVTDGANEILVFEGLERVKVAEAQAGDIVLVNGVEEVGIGVTLTSLDNPDALPLLKVDEPTLTMNFLVNASPLAGRAFSRGNSTDYWTLSLLVSGFGSIATAVAIAGISTNWSTRYWMAYAAIDSVGWSSRFSRRFRMALSVAIRE